MNVRKDVLKAHSFGKNFPAKMKAIMYILNADDVQHQRDEKER